MKFQMAFRFYRKLFRPKSVVFRMSSVLRVHEPEYLKFLDPVNPVHERLNLKVTGHDYTLVEHFQGYAHKLAMHLGVEVSDSWPCPNQEIDVTTFRPQSTSVFNTYKIRNYIRIIQLYRIEPPCLSIFLELLKATVPEGVTVTLNAHKIEDEDDRYVTDTNLLNMRRELDSIKAPPKKK